MSQIRIHFSIKRKYGETEEALGKITSIGFHVIDQPDCKKGIVRLTSINKDKFNRLKNNQLVITPDGLGTIKDYSIKRDEQGNLIQPGGVNVRVRSINKNKLYFNLNHVQVVDIVDNITGIKYPAVESDYPLLLIDDSPVEFIVNKNNRANLSLDTRHKYDNIRIFAKRQDGLRLLDQLITKKVKLIK
jgi:hypothetical protein